MVMRGDFKVSILIKLKYYLYDLLFILKRNIWGGCDKDDVFLVL